MKYLRSGTSGLHRCPKPVFKILWIVMAHFLLLSCTTIPKDFGLSQVDQLVQQRGLDIEQVSTELLEELTRQPLNAESAMRIALINYPPLQAEYSRLGFAAADLYQASRISNPVLALTRLDSNQAGEFDLKTYSLVTSFTDILTWRMRKQIANSDFDIMKHKLGALILETAMEAQSAFYHYLTASEIAKLRSKIAKTATLSSRLAQRYHAAGNMPQDELAIQQATAAENRLNALNQQALAVQARFTLANRLGLSLSQDWQLQPMLMLPADDDEAAKQWVELAFTSRLDLIAAQSKADRLAQELGLVDWSRWLNHLELGIEQERETDGARLKGPELEWELPVFNTGRDDLLRLESQLAIAVSEIIQLRLAVNNSVHLAFAGLINAKHRIKEYQTHLIPARIKAVEQAQKEENFMLIGIFELLAIKQQEYDAYEGYLQAIGDYWQARTQLAKAVGNTLALRHASHHNALNVDSMIQGKSSQPTSHHLHISKGTK